jgi:TATA-binding protein-associated factor Taf7
MFMSGLLVRSHTGDGAQSRVCAVASEVVAVRESVLVRLSDAEAAETVAGTDDDDDDDDEEEEEEEEDDEEEEEAGRAAGRELLREVVEEVEMADACVWDETAS